MCLKVCVYLCLCVVGSHESMSNLGLCHYFIHWQTRIFTTNFLLYIIETKIICHYSHLVTQINKLSGGCSIININHYYPGDNLWVSTIQSYLTRCLLCDIAIIIVTRLLSISMIKGCEYTRQMSPLLRKCRTKSFGSEWIDILVFTSTIIQLMNKSSADEYWCYSSLL